MLTAYSRNSSDGESASNTPPDSPKPAKRAVPTGVIETIAFDERQFSSLERSFELPETKGAPKKRPRSPPRPNPDQSSVADKASTTSVKKPRATSSEPPRPSASSVLVPKSEFHLSSANDYQNRTWNAPSSTSRTFADLEQYTPYIPKRVVACQSAHPRGASVVHFSPGHGHLVLSAGNDGSAKVWLSNSKKLARSYVGHSKAVRDAVFNHSGSHILTAAFDKSVLLWDVESGKVLSAFKTQGAPLCVRFCPPDPSQFLVGCGDKKVLQIDVRDASNVIQTYDEHMGRVNSISFIDSGRRFVTSADDKVLRVWEYGVPVVIKYISDPSAHSMPVTMVHPNQKWMACQSMDNTIRLFSTSGRFKRNDKRIFRGHLVAGYACGMSTSPDGRFLVSGDSLGRLFYWDWKTARLFRAVDAHKKPCCSSVDWHPTQSSFVVSCGWDGNVMFWD
ncbi:Pre-mRNA-processing factor 17 [Gracilaria domingensis]|nr:Pre-mRNA-processing factor 17 [Gracilaria domingensis]